MTKYILKDTLHATANNKNFAGETRTYYLGAYGHIAGVDEGRKVDVMLEAKISGYNRLCDAKRAQKSAQRSADWETSHGYWSHDTVEIIEVEV